MKLGQLFNLHQNYKRQNDFVQMSLERIFSYKTDVGEAEFRETMKFEDLVLIKLYVY